MSLHGARTPSTAEIDEAIAQVIRSSVVPVLTARLRRRPDAEARLSLLGYAVGITLHSYTKHHKMVLVQIVRLINSLKPHTLVLLHMPNWSAVGSYDRFQRLHAKVCAALDEGWQHADPETGELTAIDWDWYVTQVIRAPVPAEFVRGCALAVDGTPMPTWARLHGDADTIAFDGVGDT